MNFVLLLKFGCKLVVKLFFFILDVANWYCAVAFHVLVDLVVHLFKRLPFTAVLSGYGQSVLEDNGQDA